MREALVVAIVLASLCLNAAAAEELTDQKRQDIRTLLQVTGGIASASELVGPVTDQMVQIMKTSRPEIPQSVLDSTRKIVSDTIKDAIEAPGGLLDQLVPVYSQHLTHAEVRELIAFYTGPVGKKFASEQPAIAKEAYQVGVAWGQKLGPLVRDRVEAEIGTAAPAATTTPPATTPAQPAPAPQKP